MSILNEIHRSNEFDSWNDYDDLLNNLGELIRQGLVKEISVDGSLRHGWSEKWFVEMKEGVVFRLLSPDPPSRGEWSEVEFIKQRD